MTASTALAIVRFVHTLIWGFFVACIVAIPFAAYYGEFFSAAVLVAVVLLEVLVLGANHGNCPLTSLAAHYTSNRKANFDIFLPVWIARHNKAIFGSIFLGGSSYAFYAWWSASAV